jgi:hypothetical protein
LGQSDEDEGGDGRSRNGHSKPRFNEDLGERFGTSLVWNHLRETFDYDKRGTGRHWEEMIDYFSNGSSSRPHLHR